MYTHHFPSSRQVVLKQRRQRRESSMWSLKTFLCLYRGGTANKQKTWQRKKALLYQNTGHKINIHINLSESKLSPSEKCCDRSGSYVDFCRYQRIWRVCPCNVRKCITPRFCISATYTAHKWRESNVCAHQIFKTNRLTQF